MHFTIGAGYSELKNWDAARQSFEKAAELAPTNDAAAYNVALCLMHLSFDQDAASPKSNSLLMLAFFLCRKAQLGKERLERLLSD